MGKMDRNENTCVCHEEKEESKIWIVQALKDRPPKEIEEDISITVDTGAGTKLMSLETLKEDYKYTKEWSKIRNSICCIPNWENNYSEIVSLVEKMAARKEKFKGI